MSVRRTKNTQIVCVWFNKPKPKANVDVKRRFIHSETARHTNPSLSNIISSWFFVFDQISVFLFRFWLISDFYSSVYCCMCHVCASTLAQCEYQVDKTQGDRKTTNKYNPLRKIPKSQVAHTVTRGKSYVWLILCRVVSCRVRVCACLHFTHSCDLIPFVVFRRKRSILFHIFSPPSLRHSSYIILEQSASNRAAVTAAAKKLLIIS